MLASGSCEVQSLIHGLRHCPSVLGAAGEFYVREPWDSSILLRTGVIRGSATLAYGCVSLSSSDVPLVLCSAVSRCVPNCTTKTSSSPWTRRRNQYFLLS